MATRKIFKTDKFTAYELEVFTRSLSLVVEPIDAFTQELPAIPVKVELKEWVGGRAVKSKHKPVRNLSGHYCYLELPTEENGNAKRYSVDVSIDPAGNDWYFPANLAPDDLTIRNGVFDPAQHVANINLSVKPGYPFPQTATLIYGTAPFFISDGVDRAAEILLSFARIIVSNQAGGDKLFETKIDPSGSFVIFFRAAGVPAGKINIGLAVEVKGQPVIIETVETEISEGEKKSVLFSVSGAAIGGKAVFVKNDGTNGEPEKPLANAQIAVIDEETDTTIFETETDGKGCFAAFFEQSDIPDGRFKITLTGEVDGSPVTAEASGLELNESEKKFVRLQATA